MEIKVLFNAVDSEATGLQRLVYPLQALAPNNFTYEAVNTSDIRDQLRSADFVLLQCLIGPQQHSLVEYIHSQNKKVVIDYDDDFSNLPENLVKRLGMSRDGIVSNWIKYLKTADLITVPTNQLARRVRSYTSKPIKVLPNFIRQEDFKTTEDYSPFDNTDEIRIIYSCSESHKRDFNYIAPVLKRIGEWYPQVKIISHGGLDFGYHCPTYKGKHRHYTKVSYNSYYKFLKDIKPHIFIAPLTVTPHNVARSNLKYLQAGVMKAAFVASNLEPYAKTKNNALLPEFKLGWLWQLRKLIKNPNLAKELGIRASEDVEKHFVLENNIHLWRDAYVDLLCFQK